MSSNLEQLVFDAFPAHPDIVTLDTLVNALNFPRRCVIGAILRLRRRGVAEFAPGSHREVYRLVKGARRPVDMRGHHGKGGRPPARADQ